MGTPIGFWELLRRPHRMERGWRYRPAVGVPVRVSIGRLTDEPGGHWYVLVGHSAVDSLVCRDPDEAEHDAHDQAVRLMKICGPGRWEATVA